jgi:hypothetical protein
MANEPQTVAGVVNRFGPVSDVIRLLGTGEISDEFDIFRESAKFGLPNSTSVDDGLL